MKETLQYIIYSLTGDEQYERAREDYLVLTDIMCSESCLSSCSSGLSSNMKTKSNLESKAGLIFKFSLTVFARLQLDIGFVNYQQIIPVPIEQSKTNIKFMYQYVKGKGKHNNRIRKVLLIMTTNRICCC